MKQVIELVLITGLSGAGKGHALHCLEDVGYYCVDNMPLALLDPFLNYTDHQKIAVVCDVRDKDFPEQFPMVLINLKETFDINFRVYFLEAKPDILVRRFQKTRRSHPWCVSGKIHESIKKEIFELSVIKAMADWVIDTSSLTPHELKRKLQLACENSDENKGMKTTLTSFGFKYGAPIDADLLFDVRFLPNPFFDDKLTGLTGQDERVQQYVMEKGGTEFFQKIQDFLFYLLPQYEIEGKKYLTIAIGCTGGKHRSVTMVECLRKPLEDKLGMKTKIWHRDLGNE